MKVFALTVLLISICCLEGAVVKREAEEQETPNPWSAQFTEFFQKMQQHAQDFASSFQTEFGQEKLEALKGKAETFFKQVHSNIMPLTDQMTQNVAKLFTASSESQ